MFKFLSEFGPLVAFLLGYKYGEGIYDATIYMLIASVICFSFCFIIEKKVHTFSLVSSAILLTSGGLTLISGNPVFIKIKPTILYVIFAGALMISALRQRPLIKYLLANNFPIKEKGWNILSYRFAGFFFFMAILNELIWRNFAETFWVKFKVFGALPLTFLFIILQLPFLLKHKLPDTE